MWTGDKDNHTPRALLQRLVESGSEDALITRAPSGKPCRRAHSDWGCLTRTRCADTAARAAAQALTGGMSPRPTRSTTHG
jgi:hypothetical protein